MNTNTSTSSCEEAIAAINCHLETLEQCLEKQMACANNGKGADDDNNKQLIVQGKLDTKTAVANLLRCVSGTDKSNLRAAYREKLDNQLLDMMTKKTNNARLLKWPFVRALDDPRCYRTFLGLPRVMEQTRRFLSEVKPTILDEVFSECIPSNGTHQNTNNTDDPDLFLWVEQVLSYMTGDGRRKKDLAGFIMVPQSKNCLRAAINRVKARRKHNITLQKNATINNDQPATVTEAVFIDRDIRVVDQERQARQSLDLSKLVDNAAK